VPLQRPKGMGKRHSFLARYRWKQWLWIARRKKPLMLANSWVFQEGMTRSQAWKLGREEMAIKRVDADVVEAMVSPMPSNVGSWGKRYPNLVERCYATCYEGGKRRTPSRVSIEYKGGMWVATLVENDTGLMIQCEVESPDDLIPALEALLAAPTQPWQHCPWAKPKSSGRGKK